MEVRAKKKKENKKKKIAADLSKKLQRKKGLGLRGIWEMSVAELLKLNSSAFQSRHFITSIQLGGWLAMQAVHMHTQGRNGPLLMTGSNLNQEFMASCRPTQIN